MDPTNNTMPNFSPASGGVASGPVYTPPAPSAAAVSGVAGQTTSAGSGQVQGGAFVPPVAKPATQAPPSIPTPPVRPAPQAPPVPPAPVAASVASPVSPVAEPVSAKPVPAASGPRPVNIDGINSGPVQGLRSDSFATPAHSFGATSGPVGADTGDNAPEDTAESFAEESFSEEVVSQTPSVSFADPIEQPESSTKQQVSAPKKKSSGVLITLSIIAFIVAIALVAVLAMEIMGVGPFSSR